jgi:hypothetical protein
MILVTYGQIIIQKEYAMFQQCICKPVFHSVYLVLDFTFLLIDLEFICLFVLLKETDSKPFITYYCFTTLICEYICMCIYIYIMISLSIILAK